jgi:hypothetical protein
MSLVTIWHAGDEHTDHRCPRSSRHRFIVPAASVPHFVEDCKFTHNGRELLVEKMGSRNCGSLFSEWSSLCSLIYLFGQLQVEHTSDHRSYLNIRYSLRAHLKYDSTRMCESYWNKKHVKHPSNDHLISSSTNAKHVVMAFSRLDSVP